MNAICQAIQVKWLAATSHKPARLKAISKGGTLAQSVCSLENESMNPHMSLDIPAQLLAEKLAAKMGWQCALIGGQLADHTFVFVIAPQK